MRCMLNVIGISNGYSIFVAVIISKFILINVAYLFATKKYSSNKKNKSNFHVKGFKILCKIYYPYFSAGKTHTPLCYLQQIIYGLQLGHVLMAIFDSQVPLLRHASVRNHVATFLLGQ